MSESDSLQLRILGETLVESLEKPDSKVEMFNLVFTPGRGVREFWRRNWRAGGAHNSGDRVNE